MRVTKWGEFGIMCSLYLAAKESETAQDADTKRTVDSSPEASSSEQSASRPSVGAAEIAESQAIPLQYTQQILQRLRKGGIIESVRGPKGGYRLSRPAAEINLQEILFAAEGATFEVVCDQSPVHGEICATHQHRCGLRKIWQDLKVHVDDFLSKYTLAEVLTHHDFHPGMVQISNDPIVTETGGEEEAGTPAS